MAHFLEDGAKVKNFLRLGHLYLAHYLDQTTIFENTNLSFMNFSTNYKFYKSVFVLFICYCFLPQTKSDRLKKLFKFKIRSFRIVCWIWWVGHDMTHFFDDFFCFAFTSSHKHFKCLLQAGYYSLKNLISIFQQHFSISR